MKTLKYLFLIIFSLGLVNSCIVDDDTLYDLNDDGFNLAGFESTSMTVSPVASGDVYSYNVKMKVIGPTITELNNDLTLSIAVDPSSTAVSGKHYLLETTSITLKASENFLGLLPLKVLTSGNEPPHEKIPTLVLKVTDVSGDSKVTNNGKPISINLNYVFFCPFAGNYDVELKYFHPTAGGVYPTEPYGGVRAMEKELVPLAADEVQTFFGVWEDNHTMIKIDQNNNVTVTFDRSDAKPGDPNDPAKVNSYDPVTGVIQIYYYYPGAGGNRIFWEKFTPKF